MDNNDDKSKLTFTNSMDENKLIYQFETTKMELGLIGKFFGSKEAASTNVAGTVLLILVMTIPLVCFWEPAKIVPIDYIKSVLPIIGTIMGYFFGKKF